MIPIPIRVTKMTKNMLINLLGWRGEKKKKVSKKATTSVAIQSFNAIENNLFLWMPFFGIPNAFLYLHKDILF